MGRGLSSVLGSDRTAQNQPPPSAPRIPGISRRCGARDARTHGKSRSFVDLRQILPSINVSTVAMNDDRGIILLRQLASPRFCRVVAIELGRFDLGAIRLGKAI